MGKHWLCLAWGGAVAVSQVRKGPLAEASGDDWVNGTRREIAPSRLSSPVVHGAVLREQEIGWVPGSLGAFRETLN